MKYNTRQRLFIVKEYTKTSRYSRVQSAWQSSNPGKSVPSRSCILYNVDKLDKTGAVVHIPLKKPKISSKRQNAKNFLC